MDDSTKYLPVHRFLSSGFKTVIYSGRKFDLVKISFMLAKLRERLNKEWNPENDFDRRQKIYRRISEYRLIDFLDKCDDHNLLQHNYCQRTGSLRVYSIEDVWEKGLRGLA